MTVRRRLNVLLADDGSQHAQAAVELLQDMPFPPKSRIIILRAFTSGQIPVLEEFEKSLEAKERQLSEHGFQAEKMLKLGPASEQIIETAAAQKSDLIVVGAKGLRATVGILLGGVAQQVVEYARSAVLIVHAPYKGIKRILLLTDGSSYSLNAARYLGKFPLPKQIEVQVLHVLPPVPQPILMEPLVGGWQTVYAPVLPEEELAMIHRRQVKTGETLLKRTSGLLLQKGIRSTPVLIRGDAATEIIDYVKANDIDLIVAGSRGLSQIKSLWFGSVSRKLVHYSSCSILIVKGLEKGAKPWK